MRGGRDRLGRIFRLGNRYLRRLPCRGAITQVSTRRRAKGRVDRPGKISARKTPEQAAIPPAKRMMRTACVLMKTRTVFQAAQDA
jgi:hypothetical protein